MDKINAISLSKKYLEKLRNNDIKITDAWLFGSYAKGLQKENSDIDLAVVLDEKEITFDKEVKLMIIRNGEETIIEPHPFTKEEFDAGNPFVNQIIKNGERIRI
jgi:uncharacterized protein